MYQQLVKKGYKFEKEQDWAYGKFRNGKGEIL